MAEREVQQWITVNGRHVPLYAGESKEDAVKRAFASDADKKEKQIAANKKQADEMNGTSSSHKEADTEEKSLSKDLDKMSDKEIHDKIMEQFTDEDSYIKDGRFKELMKEHSQLVKKQRELDAETSKLRQVVKEESTIDKETLEMFDGDKQLAGLFAKKSAKGEEAQKKLGGLKEKKDTIANKLDSVNNRIKKWEERENEYQKESYASKTSTVTSDVKASYKGFETDTHIPYYQNLYEKGQATIVQMSPKEYLQICGLKIFPGSTYEKQVRSVASEPAVVKDLVGKMKSGTKMYMPMLNFKDKEQEGRHRAVAAMILGIEEMPVMIVRR